MATVHSMPPDTNEKEKILGGVFTLGQTLWIGGGLVIAFALALFFFRFLRLGVIILCIPPVVCGFVFALKKVGNYPLPRYLLLKHRFNKKIKYYINSGEHDSLHFSAESEEGR